MSNIALPLMGGLLIGASALFMLYFLGRITGISGIFWGAIERQPNSAWRWYFIAGLLAGPLLVRFLLNTPDPQPSQAGWLLAITGGLLVGFGVKMGGGCTSGHGVCGIGRLSSRSIAATITFMSMGILTVTLMQHALSVGG